MVSPFRIDLLDIDNTILGGGPITTAVRLNDLVSLSRMGELVFSVPAGDPRAAEITAASKFDVYDAEDGYLGRFFFSDDSLDESTGKAILSVHCYSELVELLRQTVGFQRSYTYNSVEQVIIDLANTVDWKAEVETDIGFTTLSYDGESVLGAIDEVRDRFETHYRLKLASNRILQFGNFGESSGVRLTNLRGQVQVQFAAQQNVAIVEQISRKRDAEGIINRVIPLGAGDGEAQITIEGATSGTRVIQTGTNVNGSSYFYLEDADSVARYGVRVRVLVNQTARPLTGNDTAILNAKNALKLIGESFLTKHLVERVEYDVTVRGLPATVNVGDKVRLVYRGVRENVVYLNVDEDFYVMDIRRSRSASGDRSADLKLASDNARRTTDEDILVGLTKKQGKNDTHAKLTTAPLRWEAEDTMGSDGVNSVFKYAVFNFKMNERFVDVLNLTLDFHTFPLSLNSYQNNYAVYETAMYPQFVTMLFDEEDVSSQFGGPWNTQNKNEQVDVTCDLTNLLVNSPLGLYAQHTVKFLTAGGANFDTGVLGTVNNNQLYSHGRIKAEFTAIVVVQATNRT